AEPCGLESYGVGFWGFYLVVAFRRARSRGGQPERVALVWIFPVGGPPHPSCRTQLRVRDRGGAVPLAATRTVYTAVVCNPPFRDTHKRKGRAKRHIHRNLLRHEAGAPVRPPPRPRQWPALRRPPSRRTLLGGSA